MRFIAHRGMNRRALENTLPAFRLAVEHADGIELDVQLARCGTPVCFHDDDLKAVYGIDGFIEEFTAAELGDLTPTPAPGFDVPFQGWEPSEQERIPTLDAVLQMVPAGYFVNIEIKAPSMRLRTSAPAVAQVVRENPGDYLVSSFNPVELARFARESTGVPLALLYTPDSNMVLRNGWPASVLGLAGLAALHPNWKLVSRDLVERAHQRGWHVNVWTVNDPAQASWLTQHGVDALISDQPDVLRDSAG